MQTLQKMFFNSRTNGPQIKMIQFLKSYSTKFLVLGAHDALQKTQQAVFLKISTTKIWLKTFECQVLFVFLLFPFNIRLSRTIGEIISRDTVLEKFEYDIFVSKILRVTSTANMNGSELKVKDTTPNQISSNTRAFFYLCPFL